MDRNPTYPRKWVLLTLGCKEPQEERRVRELADAIEQETQYTGSRYPAGMLHMEIKDDRYVIYR